MKNKIVLSALIASVFLIMSCQSPKSPLTTVSHVDLESFMGTWYVVGYTPILVDGKAHNATEHYYLKSDGRIQTTYQYRQGSFDGPLKTFQPTGFVYNKETNSEWRMQFVWPFKAEYRIVHLDDAYQYTIVGRTKRDYVWIMSRQADISEAKYQQLVQRVAELGYDTAKLRRVPHSVTTAESISAASR